MLCRLILYSLNEIKIIYNIIKPSHPLTIVFSCNVAIVRSFVEKWRQVFQGMLFVGLAVLLNNQD